MPDRSHEWVLLGVPTSAGAHHAGQDQAPEALRRHGLVARLQSAGLRVVDAGDVAGEVWAPVAFDAVTRNVEAVVRVALAVAAAVERECRSGRTPLVVGGDCTITLGVVAGLQRVHEDVRVVYFDGDADLGSLDGSGSGVLDATGVAHLLGIASSPLARLGAHHPMLLDHQLTLLGYDPTDPSSFDGSVLAARPDLVHASDAQVRRDPTAAAQRAVAAVAGEDAAVVVHFDVDAVDSRDLALANFPHYATGVPLAAAREVLSTVLAAPGLAALVLTEVNPTHDPTGELLDAYLDAVVSALAAAAG
jgi:arginase